MKNIVTWMIGVGLSVTAVTVAWGGPVEQPKDARAKVSENCRLARERQNKDAIEYWCKRQGARKQRDRES